MHELIKNFINGEWTAARLGKTAPNLNPATALPLGQVVVSGREDAEAAVAAAKASLLAWRRTPAPLPGQVLLRAAAERTRRTDELGRALRLEDGNTLRESAGRAPRSRTAASTPTAGG